MNCASAVMTLLLLAPCDPPGGDTINLAIAEALASPDRFAADRESDPLRRPDLVLDFFGIAQGMTVLDLFSGGGYYSEVLSRVVGDSGRVVAHNNQAYLSYAKDTLASRYADGRLPNVERVTAEADQLEFPPNTFDAALAILTWHDFYFADLENHWPAVDRKSLTTTLCSALKPGAVLGVIDHAAAPGSDPAQTAQPLHRIDPERLRQELSGTCFEYEGELDALRNPEDDLSLSVFTKGIRGRTDRFIFRFRRK